MSSKLPYKQAANVERRTWDKEAYEARAKARRAAETSSNNGPQSSLHHKHKPTVAGDANDNSNDNSNANTSALRNKEEFQKAETGAQGPMNSKRAFLKARRNKVDLEGKLGTSEIINAELAAASSTIDDTNTNSIQLKLKLDGDQEGEGEACTKITDGVTKTIGGVGWHCKVCDCFLKDSLTYLDHINGRKHQRALGYSMRIAKSTTEEVVSKLDQLAQEQQKVNEVKRFVKVKMGGDGFDDDEDGGMNEFEAVVRKKDEEIEKRKADRKKRREERKRRIREERKQLGHPQKVVQPGAKSTDTNAVDTGNSGNGNGNDEVKETMVEEEQEEDDDGGVDPDLAAIMGFSGFS